MALTSLAISRTDAVAAPTQPGQLPAVVDLAYKRRLLARLDPQRAWLEATDGERSVAREKQRVVHEVDRLRALGMPESAAVLAVQAHPEWFPTLVAERAQVNRANVRRWREQLAQGDGRPEALLVGYRAGAARRELRSEWFPEFASILTQLYFSNNGLDPVTAWRKSCEIARGTRGLDPEQIPSLPQAKRYLAKAVGERLAMMMRDPRRYRDQLAGYFMLNWDCEPGTVWIGDHRVLDIFVRHEVVAADGSRRWVPMRPYCTCWMDARSGYMLSVIIYVDSAPNHAKILEALWHAIRRNGMMPPFLLITDNGKDYLKSGALRDVTLQTQDEPTRGRNGRKTLVEEVFEDVTTSDDQEYRHSVARALGCQQKLTAPYKGRQKPIERIFRNFARQFDRLYYGYCGNAPGRGPQEIGEFSGNVMRLITAPDLVQQFRDWLPEGYHRAPTASRRTGGQSPQEMWDSRRAWRPPLSEDELSWAMLLPHRNALEVRAGPGSSNVWFRGWPYEGVSDSDVITLGDLHGQQLLVKTSWSPTIANIRHGAVDLPARIYLFSLDGRFVAEAQPAMERDVFGASQAQQDRISETCRKLAILRRADREAREALAGPGRIYAPAHLLGLQRLSGPVAPEVLPPASPDSDDPDAPAVAASQTLPTGRGRAGRAPEETASAMPDLPPADPAGAARFRAYLQHRNDRDSDDTVVDDSDAAAAFARYAASTGDSAS